jgi:hypothetical protein
MKRPREDSVLANLDGRRLFLCVLWAVLTAAFAWGLTFLEGRYPRGFAMVAFVVCLVLFIRSFKRLMSDRLQEAIERALGKLFHVLFRPAAIVIGKVAHWLGIGRWRGWGEDERTFLGRDREKVPRRQKKLKNTQKWADQEDNCARVRFLYIEYMIKRIRAGYLFRRQLTPEEIAEELTPEEDEKLLFDTYTVGRYARGAQIPDETIDRIARATARK